MDDLEIYKTLVLSTAHISYKDDIKLRDSSIQYFVAYNLDDYGWLIYVDKEYLDAVDIHSFSKGMRKSIKLAQKNKCSYLKFDRDGNTVDKLPQYDW